MAITSHFLFCHCATNRVLAASNKESREEGEVMQSGERGAATTRCIVVTSRSYISVAMQLLVRVGAQRRNDDKVDDCIGL